MLNLFEPELAPDELRAVSSIALAHMGDAVYELLARAYLLTSGKTLGRDLHRETIRLVRAEAQALAAERILPLLSEEERAVFRRGRNAHVNTVPAHATRAQYAAATALEALFGHLYLSGRKARARELFDIAVSGEEGEHAG